MMFRKAQGVRNIQKTTDEIINNCKSLIREQKQSDKSMWGNHKTYKETQAFQKLIDEISDNKSEYTPELAFSKLYLFYFEQTEMFKHSSLTSELEKMLAKLVNIKIIVITDDDEIRRNLIRKAKPIMLRCGYESVEDVSLMPLPNKSSK